MGLLLNKPETQQAKEALVTTFFVMVIVFLVGQAVISLYAYTNTRAPLTTPSCDQLRVQFSSPNGDCEVLLKQWQSMVNFTDR